MILCGQPLPSFSCKVFPAQELLLNPRQRPQAFLIMLCLGIARFASTQTFHFPQMSQGISMRKSQQLLTQVISEGQFVVRTDLGTFLPYTRY